MYGTVVSGYHLQGLYKRNNEEFIAFPLILQTGTRIHATVFHRKVVNEESRFKALSFDVIGKNKGYSNGYESGGDTHRLSARVIIGHLKKMAEVDRGHLDEAECQEVLALIEKLESTTGKARVNLDNLRRRLKRSSNAATLY